MVDVVPSGMQVMPAVVERLSIRLSAHLLKPAPVGPRAAALRRQRWYCRSSPWRSFPPVAGHRTMPYTADAAEAAGAVSRGPRAIGSARGRYPSLEVGEPR